VEGGLVNFVAKWVKLWSKMAY